MLIETGKEYEVYFGENKRLVRILSIMKIKNDQMAG